MYFYSINLILIGNGICTYKLYVLVISIFFFTQRPSQMNLNEANGRVSGGLDGMSNGEGALQTIQEDQEPDSDQQPIEVCDLVDSYLSLCLVGLIKVYDLEQSQT